jgi:uncharacterized protein YdhG (YjbR/CyaY superfamily)
MIEFTNSKKLAKLDPTKMEKFIAIFNKEIDRLVVEQTTGIVAVHKNTTLDKLPDLNKAELTTIQHNARLNGWNLTEHEDEHDSITYKLIVL